MDQKLDQKSLVGILGRNHREMDAGMFLDMETIIQPQKYFGHDNESLNQDEGSVLERQKFVLAAFRLLKILKLLAAPCPTPCSQDFDFTFGLSVKSCSYGIAPPQLSLFKLKPHKTENIPS